VRADPALRPPHGRYTRESVEFARLANLSDAVFAIAMTLLVLGLDVPDVAATALAGALREVVPQLVAFVLGFALVANVWWLHHRLFSCLDVAERGLIALDLALLGVVALVPFPTGLVGRYPTETAAVLPFVAVMSVAAIVSFVAPVAALVVLASSGLPEVVLARRAPVGYRDWP
jgi:uncharacterized membrane protein